MADKYFMDIKDIVDNISRLPLSSLNALTAAVTEIVYPKNFHLFHESKKGSKSYFIKEGLVRAYVCTKEKEATIWFGKEGDLVFPLQTLFAGLGEYASVELLEDCILYEMDLNRLQELYASDIHLANWGRKYAEYACIKAEKLFLTRYFKNSQERYQELLSEFPEIIQRVPLGLIASYLNMSQVNLSRIRALIK